MPNKYYLNQHVIKNRHILLAKYFKEKADPDMDGSWGGTSSRAFKNLPYHQIQSNIIPTTTLCNLPFIEARSQIGDLREFILDYIEAEINISDIDLKISNWYEWKYFVMNEIHTFERYSSEYPQIIFQQAYNTSKLGAVAIAAQKLLESGRMSQKLWFERVNRPKYFTISSKLYTVIGDNKEIHAICISKDGNFLISGSQDSSILIWSTKTGECLYVLEGHDDAVISLDVVDKDRVISASYDDTLRIWNLKTGRCQHKLIGHTGPVTFVSVLDSEQALSISKDMTIRLWDISTGKCSDVLKGHSKEINHVIKVDVGTLVSASNDGKIIVWDISEGKIKDIFTYPDCIPLYLETSNDCNIICAFDNGKIRIINLKSNKITEMDGHDGPVVGLCKLTDNMLLSWSFDNSICLWSLKTYRMIRISSMKVQYPE